MPCYSEPPSLNEQVRNIEKEIQHYKNKADEATRFLCDIIKSGIEQNPDMALPKELNDWWENHKKLDEIRK